MHTARSILPTLLLALAVASCGPTSKSQNQVPVGGPGGPINPPDTQARTFVSDTQLLAQKQLSELDRLTPKPYPCDNGWAASRAGYVVEVAGWAERAGLRRGDKIVAIVGTTVTSPEERGKALYQVPIGGPIVLSVTRQGQLVTLSLPCRSQAERYRAVRRTLEAAFRGDWKGCIAAAAEERQLAGFPILPAVWWQYECTRIITGGGSSPDFAYRSYELSSLMVRQSRYVPGGTEDVRAEVLRVAIQLREKGFPTYASDLEAQLREALAAQAVEPPSAMPSQPTRSVYLSLG